MSNVNAADQAVAWARTQIGKPYVFGAAGPDSYDCSGLTMKAYEQVGIKLAHSTYSQVLQGTGVSKAELRVGDLVFPDAGHVQLYSGNGKVIEAPHTGANVREVDVWGFWRARRLVPGGGTGAVTTTLTANVQPVGLNIINLTGKMKIAGAQLFGFIFILIGMMILTKTDPRKFIPNG